VIRPGRCRSRRMGSRPIVPRVIALPPAPWATAEGRGGGLAVCVGSSQQIRTIEHSVGATGARLFEHLAGLERRQRSGWFALIRSRFRSPHQGSVAALRYGRRVLATFALHSASCFDPAVYTRPYSGEPLRETGFAVRIRGPRRLVSSVDALVVLRPPASSLFETRVGQRWAQAMVIAAETANHALGRRLVGVDGWSTEDWLARPARSDRHESRAITSDATGAVDPTLSAATLLALRTQLVATGARDG
jgi:hypothetical protein